MLHGLCLIAHPVACTCMSLAVVAQGLSPVKLFNFLFSVIAEAWCNNVGSVCTALPTLLGPCSCIAHGLQSLIGVPFPRCTAGPTIAGPTMLGVVASVFT